MLRRLGEILLLGTAIAEILLGIAIAYKKENPGITLSEAFDHFEGGKKAAADSVKKEVSSLIKSL